MLVFFICTRINVHHLALVHYNDRVKLQTKTLQDNEQHISVKHIKP